MEFHVFTDGWAEMKRAMKALRGRERKQVRDKYFVLGPVRYYDRLADELHQIIGGGRSLVELQQFEICSSMTNIVSQQAWRGFGAPYYKIWPEMTHLLSEVDLRIQTKFLHMPYPSFALYMPKGERHALWESGGPPMKSCLVSKIGNDASVGNVKLLRGKWEDRDWSMQLEYHFDAVDLDGSPLIYSLAMPMYDDWTIEKCLQVAIERSSEYDDGSYVPSHEFCERLLTLVVSTCFFGVNQHEFVMPDLPRKKIVRYHEARRRGEEGKMLKEREERARKSGKGLGWSVGSEVDLPSADVEFRYTGDAISKKEQKFAQMRRGHMRLQPYGPRENPTYKLIFIKPTVVRPDLPLKASHGYRLKDELIDRMEGS